MRFVLIDRIIDLQPGQSLVAIKNLSLAEEYLADHFPGFPVMPGVLMLEALTQAGAWLIRDMENFGPHYQDAEKSSIGVNLWEVDPAGAQPVTVERDLNSIGDKLYSSPGIEPVEATIEQTR